MDTIDQMVVISYDTQILIYAQLLVFGISLIILGYKLIISYSLIVLFVKKTIFEQKKNARWNVKNDSFINLLCSREEN